MGLPTFTKTFLSRTQVTISRFCLFFYNLCDSPDAAKAQWFPLDKVPSLAFDHDLILREATNELRRQIHFEPIGFELLPEKFTMTQLQHLYEAILSVKFDRRNFCNKMLKLGILTQLDETLPMPNKKLAFLYKFNPDSYNEMKEKGFRLEF